MVFPPQGTTVSTTATDSFPGFTTSITTDGFAEISGVFAMNTDGTNDAILQKSTDGGSTWTTIETHPAGLSDKTVSVSIPIDDGDTLQFRDNSAGSSTVTNQDYMERQIA